MDECRGLITEVIDAANFKTVQQAGIDESFLDEDTIPVFRYIQRHTSEYKKTPSRDSVKKAFPGFEFTDYKEPLEYYIRSLQEAYRRNLLDESLTEVNRVYLRDTERAEAELRSLLKRLHVSKRSHKDIHVAKSAQDRVLSYQARKLNPGADGVLSNWPTLDYQTLGWHPEEFVVLVGEKYMGKSWLMLWLSYQAALQGEKVLFITKEMSQEAVVRRFDSIYAQVCFDSLRRGELSDIEEKRYEESMENLAKSNANMVVARQGVNTVEDIRQKAVEIEASIVFADSVYLFDPDANWKNTGEVNRRRDVSQKAKDIASDLSVPFVVSVQAGRKKTKERIPSLDDIEWTNAFSQDADTVFFLEKTDLDKDLSRAQIYLLKSRDGDVATFYIDQDFSYMQFKERKDQTQPSTQIFDEEEEESIFDGEE